VVFVAADVFLTGALSFADFAGDAFTAALLTAAFLGRLSLLIGAFVMRLAVRLRRVQFDLFDLPGNPGRKRRR